MFSALQGCSNWIVDYVIQVIYMVFFFEEFVQLPGSWKELRPGKIGAQNSTGLVLFSSAVNLIDLVNS